MAIPIRTQAAYVCRTFKESSNGFMYPFRFRPDDCKEEGSSEGTGYGLGLRHLGSLRFGESDDALSAVILERRSLDRQPQKASMPQGECCRAACGPISEPFCMTQSVKVATIVDASRPQLQLNHIYET